MEPLTCATTTGPIFSALGAVFYFSPASIARAESIGLDVVSLYGAGRGGALHGQAPQEIDQTFFFFKPGMIAAMVERGRSLAEPEVIWDAHLGGADDFARATFTNVDASVFTGFADAAEVVVAAAPRGRWPIFDGYRAAPMPEDHVARAYRSVIALRELRGGVHTDAVVSLGLSGAVACQLDQGDGYFKLHGFTDDDKVPVTDELLASKAAAEQRTDEAMAELFAALRSDQLEELVAGAAALEAAAR